MHSGMLGFPRHWVIFKNPGMHLLRISKAQRLIYVTGVASGGTGGGSPGSSLASGGGGAGAGADKYPIAVDDGELVEIEIGAPSAPIVGSPADSTNTVIRIKNRMYPRLDKHGIQGPLQTGRYIREFILYAGKAGNSGSSVLGSGGSFGGANVFNGLSSLMGEAGIAGGRGGDSPFGFGGAVGATNTAGVAGDWGAGGGGGGGTTSGGTTTGGLGGPSFVMIEW